MALAGHSANLLGCLHRWNGEEGAMSIAPGSVWIGDNEEIVGPGGGAGSIAVFDQDLFAGHAESWDRGDPVGSAHGVFVLTPNGTALTTITLEFNDGSTLVAVGSLPFESSIGDGVLAVTGRTGNLERAHARLRVEVSNPKRYSNQP
jgi:hypothetical protein